MHRFILFILILSCTALAQEAELRTWTNSSGKTIEATYQRSLGTLVILKTREGKTLRIRLTALSKADRDYVRSRAFGAPARPLPGRPVKPGGPGTPVASPASVVWEGRLTGSWVLEEFDGLPYAVYAEPELGKGDRKYPLVIGLHGKTDKNDNGHQKYMLRAFTKKAVYKDHPAFLLAPMCYQPHGGTGGGWSAKPGKQTITLTEEMIENLPIDENRIYVLGYSMGGGGTIELMTREPKLFAAGICIAGWDNGEAASKLKKKALWAFHGAKDPVVKPGSIQRLADKLKKNPDFKYTEYPDGDHGIVGKVWQEDGIMEWLFSKSL